MFSGDDAELFLSEGTQGAQIVHHDLLLSSGAFFALEVRIAKASMDAGDAASEKDPVVRKTRSSFGRETRQSVVAQPAITIGVDARIDTDDVLTPTNSAVLDWIETASTKKSTLRVVAKLLDKQSGGALSLQSGYDTTKITPQWSDATGELSLDVGSGTTVAQIQDALCTLSLHTELSSSDSARRVWVFPTLSGVGNFRYRADVDAGLVRYYLYEHTDGSFSSVSLEALERSLFDKSGYLGVPTSSAEKSVYASFGRNGIFLAISDIAAKGVWRVTSGPRKGRVFWDDTHTRYGSGATGSDWTARVHFWSGIEPNGGVLYNNAQLDSDGGVYDTLGNRGKSVVHVDFFCRMERS